MTPYAILSQAIESKQCLRLLIAGGWTRYICPYALGFKSGRLRLLAFQFAGDSVAGLVSGGEWRTFFLTDIAAAVPIEAIWRAAPLSTAKLEACLDRIQCRVKA